MATSQECCDRQHLGSGDHALTTAPVYAHLKHGFLSSPRLILLGWAKGVLTYVKL